MLYLASERLATDDRNACCRCVHRVSYPAGPDRGGRRVVRAERGMLHPDGAIRCHSRPLCDALRDRVVTRMDRETRLETIRRAYATQTMAAAGVVDRRIEAAFAAVKRKDFLGPGPWQILRWDRGYEKAPSADPVYLYDDVVVAIVPERNLNNGQPAFLAALIAGGAPRPGRHAVHTGIGVGAYPPALAPLDA